MLAQLRDYLATKQHDFLADDRNLWLAIEASIIIALLVLIGVSGRDVSPRAVLQPETHAEPLSLFTLHGAVKNAATRKVIFGARVTVEAQGVVCQFKDSYIVTVPTNTWVTVSASEPGFQDFAILLRAHGEKQKEMLADVNLIPIPKGDTTQ